MSRHKIACRDKLNLWWDKSSLGCDSKYFLCVMMSRQLPLGGSSLVATSALKLYVQRAFHSLATLKSSASNKSISNSNSYMYSIHFSQNLYREKNASLFLVTPSCELLKLFPNCLFSHFLEFLHKHSTTFMERI